MSKLFMAGASCIIVSIMSIFFKHGYIQEGVAFIIGAIIVTAVVTIKLVDKP
jgi:hypothetical protein